MKTDPNLDALNRLLHEQKEYDARTITCPECNGEGTCAYEEEVADYDNGGYLKEVIDTCETCGGSGEVERDEEE